MNPLFIALLTSLLIGCVIGFVVGFVLGHDHASAKKKPMDLHVEAVAAENLWREDLDDPEG